MPEEAANTSLLPGAGGGGRGCGEGGNGERMVGWEGEKKETGHNKGTSLHIL